MSSPAPLKLPRVLPHLIYYEDHAPDQFPPDIPRSRLNRWAGPEQPYHPKKLGIFGPHNKPSQGERTAGVVLILLVLGAGLFFIIQDVVELIDEPPRILSPFPPQIIPPLSDFLRLHPAPQKQRPGSSEFRCIFVSDLIRRNFVAFSGISEGRKRKSGIVV